MNDGHKVLLYQMVMIIFAFALFLFWSIFFLGVAGESVMIQSVILCSVILFVVAAMLHPRARHFDRAYQKWLDEYRYEREG